MIVFNLIMAFCLSILINYVDYSDGKSVELRVSSQYNSAVHYNELTTALGVFQSGADGILVVQPRSFNEACMLRYITSNTFNVLDFIYFLSIACFLWWMTYDIRKEDIFSKKVISGLRWIGWSIAVYGILKMLHVLLVNSFISHFSEGVFSAQKPEFLEYRFFLGAIFFQLIPMFIQKARQIQREQNLTI